MKRKMATCCFYMLMMLSSVFVFAQKIEPPEPKPNGPPVGPGLPIDSGITFLLITGAAYGVYALKKNKKSLIND